MQCTNCEGTNFTDDYTTGDSICAGCGVVLERIIDFEHEDKRTFNADRSSAGGKEDNARTSNIDGVSGSVIGLRGDRNPNSSGTKLLTELSTTNHSTQSYKDTKISDGKKNISNYCDNLSLNARIRSRAESIWVEYETARKKYSRGGNKEMYLAIIYTACREMNYSRTLKEIAAAMNTKMNDIASAQKKLMKARKQEATPATGEKMRGKKKSHGDNLKAVIPRIGLQLEMSYGEQERVKSILPEATSHLEGKQPDTIAAAAILFFVRHIGTEREIKEKDVASSAGIASSTLRNAYKILEEHSSALMQILERSAAPA